MVGVGVGLGLRLALYYCLALSAFQCRQSCINSRCHIYIVYLYATAYIQYAKDVFVKMIFCVEANIIYIVFELNYTRSAVSS